MTPEDMKKAEAMMEEFIPKMRELVLALHETWVKWASTIDRSTDRSLVLGASVAALDNQAQQLIAAYKDTTGEGFYRNSVLN